MAATEKKQEILLESGTNELEVLVFRLGPTRYGVNVAKVREVIGQAKMVKVPKMHLAVVGVFKLRDSVIPLVDLQLYFDPAKPSKAAQRSVILMEFNEVQVGFLVDSVERIFRLSWNEVQPMPVVPGKTSSVITSVCVADGKMALMVDFEKIAFDINGNKRAYEVASDIQGMVQSDRASQSVLLAEDSQTIRHAIHSNLVAAGYSQITALSDGAQAWSALLDSLRDDGTTPYTFVVTDIEMPRMDGLHLCKRIREHPQLKHLPVVVFSSLVSDSNLKKCKAVGADAALTKPQMTKLVELLDGLLAGCSTRSPQADKRELVTIPQ